MLYIKIYPHIFYNIVTKYYNLRIVVFEGKLTIIIMWLNWFPCIPERQPDGYVHLFDVFVGPETQMNLFSVGKSL